MHVQVTLTKPGYILAPGGRKVSDKAYLNFCEANRDLQVERTPEGQIIVVPPAGFESEDRNMEVVTQLRTWANKDGRGRVTGPTSRPEDRLHLSTRRARRGPEEDFENRRQSPVGPHRAACGPLSVKESDASGPRAGSVVRRGKPFVLQLRTIWKGLK